MSSHTRVIYVRNGIPASSEQFDFGSDRILKEFSDKMSLSKEVAHSYIRLFREDKLHGTTSEHVKKTVQNISTSWSKELLVCITKICTEIVLPKSIFIIPRDEFGLLLAEHVIGHDTGTPALASQFSIDLVDENKLGVIESSKNQVFPRPIFSILAKYIMR